MTLGIVPNIVTSIVRTQSDPNYPGLDEQGHTPQDIACFNDPSCDFNQYLMQLEYEMETGTGRGYLPEVTPASVSGFLGVPTWAWLLGSGALAVLLLRGRG